LLALSQVRARRGDVAEAQSLACEAQELVICIADWAGTADLRESFLVLPDVQAVLQWSVE
jgi:hypothetical protein